MQASRLCRAPLLRERGAQPALVLGRGGRHAQVEPQQFGARLAAGLADAAREAGVALQVNGIGSVLTPFFTSTPVRNYQSSIRSDAAKYGTFFRAMLARGIYPPPSQFEAWFLSAAHTKRDVDATMATMVALRPTPRKTFPAGPRFWS